MIDGESVAFVAGLKLRSPSAKGRRHIRVSVDEVSLTLAAEDWFLSSSNYDKNIKTPCACEWMYANNAADPVGQLNSADKKQNIISASNSCFKDNAHTSKKEIVINKELVCKLY